MIQKEVDAGHGSAVVRIPLGLKLRTYGAAVSPSHLTVEHVASTLGTHSTKVILALEEGPGDLGRERVVHLARIYGIDHALMLRVNRTRSVELPALRLRR